MRDLRGEKPNENNDINDIITAIVPDRESREAEDATLGLPPRETALLPMTMKTGMPHRRGVHGPRSHSPPGNANR